MQLAPVNFYNYLHSIVLLKPAGCYLVWVESSLLDSGMKFYGSIEAQSFTITPLIAGRNFFTPIFRGSYGGSESETMLHVTVKDSPFSIGMILFMTIAVVTSFLETVANLRTVTWQDVLWLAIPVGLWLAFYLLNRYFKRKAVHRFFNALPGNPYAG